MPVLYKLLLPVAFLLLPAFAQAADVTTWDFARGAVPGDWGVRGWTSAVPTDQGLRVRTEAGGSMTRPTGIAHGIDVIRIVTAANAPQEGLFLWHIPGAPEGELVQIPLTFQPGAESVLHVDPTIFPEWPRRPDEVGIALPAGTEIVIRRIELIGFSPLEKLVHMWNSFWTFDFFNAGTINFLWGPVLRATPVDRNALFGLPPPQGWSANRVYYAVLLAAGIAALALHFWNKRPARQALLLFFGVAAVLWISYDLRMGTEFLSGTVEDFSTHVAKPPGERTFRIFDNLYDALDTSLPVLQAEPAYVFLAPEGAPFETRARYLTFPSLPVKPDARPLPRTWFVFWRDDVSVDGQGRLVQKGQVLAGSGKVLERFGEYSFLYQTP